MLTGVWGELPRTSGNTCSAAVVVSDVSVLETRGFWFSAEPANVYGCPRSTTSPGSLDVARPELSINAQAPAALAPADVAVTGGSGLAVARSAVVLVLVLEVLEALTALASSPPYPLPTLLVASRPRRSSAFFSVS